MRGGCRPIAPQPTAVVVATAVFHPTAENSRAARGPSVPGMVWIPGGEFSMGAAEMAGMNSVGMQATVDSRPIHRVYVDGFWMDATEVTNDAVREVRRATGYVTDRRADADARRTFPARRAENLVAGSVVFTPPDHAGAAQ